MILCILTEMILSKLTLIMLYYDDNINLNNHYND